MNYFAEHVAITSKINCVINYDMSIYFQKPPFADCGRDNDLGAFFRECQSAPPLVSFISQPTLAQSLSDVEDQISKFEQGMKEIDEFIDSFCNVDLEQ